MSDLTLAGGRSAAATSPACLVQIYGGELGKRVRLSAGEIVIGRDERCGPGVDQSTVSRRHSRVFISEGVVLVVTSEEHTSELQSQSNLVCRLLLEKTRHL